MTTPNERTPMALQPLLDETATYASGFLEGLAERRVAPTATAEELREQLGGPLPDEPHEPRQVVADLAKRAEPGLMAMPGRRFFGFVIGGSLPAALAADWLVSTWDQNTGLYAPTPATSIIEEVCGAWLIELLGLPEDASFGFVTGCQMAHFTALAAARHHVLETDGWDVEANGLTDAPPVRVVLGEERH
ncbi:MAG TPA: pyridoxal-dependent decarboxylase, partial [Rubrobacteraceae bacterium]|nr:pyridoxal-dependent decarboxylase [Rubrobacteraceae bacterium]